MKQSLCGSLSRISCMLLVFASLFRPRVTARAFQSSSSFARIHTLSASRKINGEEGDLESAESTKAPPGKQARTGWNHNLPSESSTFWEGAESLKQSQRTSSSGEDKPTALRTGWLHNSEPREAQSAKESSSKPVSLLARKRLELAMKQQRRNHRILHPPTFHTGANSQIMVTEHMLSVPLSRDPSSTQAPSSDRVDVYFSVVEKIEAQKAFDLVNKLSSMSPTQRAAAYVEFSALKDADGMMLYLQGGPGFGAPTPVVSLGFSSADSSWAAAALEISGITKIVLMDQRGTGRSTPVTKQTLELRFPELFLLDCENGNLVGRLDENAEADSGKVAKVRDAAEQATHYMSQFRADSIVRDAEEIRDALLLPVELEEDPKVENKPRPWGCALGLSYGGFCLMTYLSQVAVPPKLCLLTGGIAPILTPIDEVYMSLSKQVRERNLRFYEKYPGDILVVKEIVRRLMEEPAKLPSGGNLTARRFLQLGLGLGGSPSSFASLHALISSALLPVQGTSPTEKVFSRSFLKQMDVQQSFDDHPIYFWMHEAIYADGPTQTKWSAHRVMETAPEFKFEETVKDDAVPVLFFGEMVFPWMSEDYAELSGYGLTELAHNLAHKEDWGPLYDAEHMKRVLSDGTSRAAAAVYHEDMYVDFHASCQATWRGTGPLEKCKVWVTNEYQHSGLRDDGAKIIRRLIGMAKGSIQVPS